jgi:hypothetical protein
VTSPALTGIGSHVNGSDRVRMRNRLPRFFLTIVVVQNVSLCMTDRATVSNVTGFPRVRTCATGSWGFLPTRVFSPEMTLPVGLKKSTGKRLSNGEILLPVAHPRELDLRSTPVALSVMRIGTTVLIL